jgi:hypothetical protein
MSAPKQLVEGGHMFVTTDDEGTIDNWQYDSGFHNGPRCENCNMTWCEHCEPNCYGEICPGKGIIVVQESTPRKVLEA